MLHAKFRTIVLVLPLLIGLLAVQTAGQIPLGTAFTYQGRLTSGAAPAGGAYDFHFILYDASEGGSQVGPLLTNDDVVVTNGLFTLTLDFGAVFAGAKRWLEISVRPGATSGGYSVLSPRQELTPSPGALFSSVAGTFTGALAGEVTGVQGATVVSNAVSANTANAVVRRDGGGNFAAGTITASLDGNATSATIFTAPLAGDVIGPQGATVVTAGLPINIPDTIVRRDFSGGFAAGPIVATGLVVGNDQLVLSGGNVGVGTAAPASRLEVAGDLIRTLARSHGYGNDQTDNGALLTRVLTFTKKRVDTGLRLTYTDNFRVLTTNSAGRWQIRFDGASCSNPGPLVYDLYSSQSTSFMHIPVTVTGTCFGLSAGPHTIQVYVGPSPGYAVSDLSTGWNNQYWALEAEEVR